MTSSSPTPSSINHSTSSPTSSIPPSSSTSSSSSTSPPLTSLLSILNSLDAELLKFDYCRTLRDSFNVRPSLVAIGITVVVFLFLFYGFGQRFVSNLVSFCYPLYESFRSLTDERDVTSQHQWLTYWVVFGFVTLVESGTHFLELWIPLYYIMKIAFFVWCFMPQTRGAEMIYHNIINPILTHFESKIDYFGKEVEEAEEKVEADVDSSVEGAANDYISQKLSNLIPHGPGGAPQTEATKKAQ